MYIGLESQTEHKIDSSIMSVPHFLAQKVFKVKIGVGSSL